MFKIKILLNNLAVCCILISFSGICAMETEVDVREENISSSSSDNTLYYSCQSHSSLSEEDNKILARLQYDFQQLKQENWEFKSEIRKAISAINREYDLRICNLQDQLNDNNRTMKKIIKHNQRNDMIITTLASGIIVCGLSAAAVGLYYYLNGDDR